MFFDSLIKSIDDIVVNLALSQVCLDSRKFCRYSVEALSELVYVGRRENRSGFKGFESQLCLQSSSVPIPGKDISVLDMREFDEGS